MFGPLLWGEPPCGSILARTTSSKQPLYFLLLASPKKKNKQTTKQKERWQGHCNSCGQLQRVQRVPEVQIMSLWVQFNYRRDTRFQSDLSPYWSLLGPRPLARESLASFHRTRLAFLECSGDRQWQIDMGCGGGGGEKSNFNASTRRKALRENNYPVSGALLNRKHWGLECNKWP